MKIELRHMLYFMTKSEIKSKKFEAAKNTLNGDVV